MENEKIIIQPGVETKRPPAEKKATATGAGKFADILLGILISIAAADILSFLWLAAIYITDLGYANWSRFWSDYESGMFLGVNIGGLVPVFFVAIFGSASKTRWKYLFRGMLILPLGVLIFFLLGIGVCMLILNEW
jgi:hypothetical protein